MGWRRKKTLIRRMDRRQARLSNPHSVTTAISI
jgi:hypothetical protein